MSIGSRRVPAGAALFVALFTLSCILAVAVVRSRTPDLMLEVCAPNPDQALVFSPRAIDGPTEARLDFFVRTSDPAARIAIVNAREDVIRTLDDSVALADGERVTYEWDGRDDDGEFVADGRYRLRVDLPDSDREMIWPRRLVFASNPANVTEPGQNACDPLLGKATEPAGAGS